jgi:hypothetical protein
VTSFEDVTLYRVASPEIADKPQERRNEMAVTSERVREIFKGLEHGDGAAFF